MRREEEREQHTVTDQTDTMAPAVFFDCHLADAGLSTAGVGNVDDGDGPLYLYRQKYLKIADLQAQKSKRIDILFLDILVFIFLFDIGYLI